MPFPIGVGVGDFIASINLILEIGKALRDSVGSAKQFKDLVAQFSALETPLIFAKRYAHNRDIDGEEKKQLLELIRVFQEKIDDILAQLDRYLIHLGYNHESIKDKSRATLAKVKFHLLKSDDISRWQNSLAIHAASLNATISIINTSETGRLRREWMEYRVEDLKSSQLGLDYLRQFVAKLNQLSHQMNASSDQTAMVLGDNATILASIQALLVSALAELTNARELDELRRNEDAFRANKKLDSVLGLESKILQELESVKANMTVNFTQLTRPPHNLVEEPVTFEDAAGEVSRFFTDWVTTAEVFQAHLEERWKHRPGLQMIKDKHYVLNDALTGDRVEIANPLSKVFFPGRTVLMSMRFKETFAYQPSTFCPGCYTETGEVSDGSPVCTVCGLSCRRITNVDAEEFPLTALKLPNVPSTAPAPNLMSSFRRVQVVQLQATPWSEIFDNYNELQQQLTMENMQMQLAQAFWNPLESMSKRDATS